MPDRHSPFLAALFSVFLIGLSGCATGPKYLAKDYAPPARVAVLPFGNETNDVDGPESVRKLLTELLPTRGYVAVPEDRVDQVLKEKFGITDGGQLDSVTPQELGKALDVDGLIYGNLISFVDIPLGFASKRTVKAEFRLVDAKSGEKIWEDRKGWTTPELHLNAREARDAAIRQVAQRQIEKMTGTFLRTESLIVIRMALDNLPLGTSPALPVPESLRPHWNQVFTIQQRRH